MIAENLRTDCIYLGPPVLAINRWQSKLPGLSNYLGPKFRKRCKLSGTTYRARARFMREMVHVDLALASY